MRKIIILNLAILIILAAIHCYAQELKEIEPFNKNDRVLILAPHPDDEAIACAGVIQDAIAAGAHVHIAFLTNGDHNEIAFIVFEKRFTLRQGEFIHMGKVRRVESIEAMKLLGLHENDLTFLGYPDFGTFAILCNHWQNSPPYKSMMTRISAVPYKEDLSFGAAYKGENILKDIESVLLDYKPNKIFVSHPADANVDHRALYLFLQIALRDLDRQLPQPKIYPYLVHCLGWPLPRHYHPQLSLQPPTSFTDKQINWLKLDLTPEQVNKKYQAILCYKSQTESSAFYLLAFARKDELFGDYPDIELNKQVSVREKGVSFFGFSDMYMDSDTGVLGGLEGIEDKGRVDYAAVDNYILIRIKKSKEFTRFFNFQLYIFGYNGKQPFSSMPKIRLLAENRKFQVFDGKEIIKPQGVSMDINSNELVLKIPLSVLGNPNFILTSIKSYGGKQPFDSSAFRKIYLK